MKAILNEGSITAIPANPKALIQRVASADGDKVAAEEEELDLETLKAMREMVTMELLRRFSIAQH